LPDEAGVIRRVLAGDSSAFREIVDQHGEMIYRLAFRLTGIARDAEDLSQEVFLKAYQALGSFRQESKLSSWLYRICVNIYLDGRARSKPISLEREHGRNYEATDSSADPGRLASSAILQRHIQRALLSLSPRERAVFVLRHYHELPIKEIGDVLSIRPGTVKALLFRAVQNMQKELAFCRKDITG
jgi:RNA polymerase sigma-70 factor, ECF subfamily